MCREKILSFLFHFGVTQTLKLPVTGIYQFETIGSCLRLFVRFQCVQKPTDIHRRLCQVYEEHTVSDSMVRRWVRSFNDGRENVHDDRTKRRTVCDQRRFAARGRRKRTADSQFRQLSIHFPRISRSRLHEIVSHRLEFRKLYRLEFRKLCRLEFRKLRSRWLQFWVTSFYEARIQKLVFRYDNYRNNDKKDVKDQFKIYTLRQISKILGINTASLQQLMATSFLDASRIIRRK